MISVTTSAQTQLTLTSSPDKELSSRQLAFFEGLAQNRAHEAVLQLIERLAREGRLSRASLAKKLGRSPSQITRWLGSPGNWTLQTLGILLGAMGYVPVISAHPINERVATNYSHPAAELSKAAQFVQLRSRTDDDVEGAEVLALSGERVHTSTSIAAAA